VRYSPATGVGRRKRLPHVQANYLKLVAQALSPCEPHFFAASEGAEAAEGKARCTATVVSGVARARAIKPERVAKTVAGSGVEGVRRGGGETGWRFGPVMGVGAVVRPHQRVTVLVSAGIADANGRHAAKRRAVTGIHVAILELDEVGAFGEQELEGYALGRVGVAIGLVPLDDELPDAGQPCRQVVDASGGSPPEPWKNCQSLLSGAMTGVSLKGRVGGEVDGRIAGLAAVEGDEPVGADAGFGVRLPVEAEAEAERDGVLRIIVGSDQDTSAAAGDVDEVCRPRSVAT